jgi:hypothetical protein
MASSNKTLILASFFAVFLAGCGAVFVNEGSQNAFLAEGLKNPDKPPKPQLSRASRLMGDFEDGTTSMNPKLYSSNEGSWMATNGSEILSGFIAAGGANGTTRAAHLRGMVVDTGDFSYPALVLQGKFHANGNYDASLFIGVRFYYKNAPDDKAHRSRFSVAIAPTVSSSEGGSCLDQCGNHYGANINPSAEWTQVSYKFGDLAREQGWGATVTPPGLPDHLQELVYLKWEHGANNVKGTFMMDYSIDEVEFF